MNDSMRRTLRTLVAVVGALAPVAPVLVAALGLPTSAGIGAVIIALSGVITKVMATETVDSHLPSMLSKGVPDEILDRMEWLAGDHREPGPSDG